MIPIKQMVRKQESDLNHSRRIVYKPEPLWQPTLMQFDFLHERALDPNGDGLYQ